MLMKQIIKFQLRGPGPPGCRRVLYHWLFPWQNKNFEEKSSSGFLFTAQILQEAIYLTSPIPGQNHLQNLTPKCKILNMFWS